MEQANITTTKPTSALTNSEVLIRAGIAALVGAAGASLLLLFIKHLAESGEESKKPDEKKSKGSLPDNTSEGYGFFISLDLKESKLHSKEMMAGLNTSELKPSIRKSKSTSYLKKS